MNPWLMELEAFARVLGEELPDPDLIDRGRPCSLARAPGRLDVMGGISDYSGSLVLELPLREGARAAAQRREDGRVRVASLDAQGGAKLVGFALSELTGGAASTYPKAREFFRRTPEDHWAAYLAGALAVLRMERGVPLGHGMTIVLSSDVPEGKGVSSPAAIEVATMRAIAAELGLVLDPTELAALCQKVENLVVGAPCGLMDQMTAACGEQGRLLELRCQPAEIRARLPLCPEIELFGIDSGVRHAVTGADYATVRVAAFMGYRIILEREGIPVEPAREPGGPARVSDPLYGGYLANVSPSVLAERYLAVLPETLSGESFLTRYGGTTDPVTRIEPERAYPVRAATLHPVHEHFRVRAFARLLASAANPSVVELLGELMYQSHASYSACGLGSRATDRLVELVREAGAREGLLGARITGGGSGGTVAVLARSGAAAAVERVAALHARETGRPARVFRGSSPGAAALGVFRLLPGGDRVILNRIEEP